MSPPIGLGLGLGITSVLGTASIPALAQVFKSTLFSGGSDMVLGVYGDSTGNATDEWMYLLTTAFESNDLVHYIDYYLYNDTSKTHVLTALLGRQSTFSVMTDTFDRADGSLGTTSSGGQSWGSNSWTIASGIAVPNATSSNLIVSTTLSSSSFKIVDTLKYPSAGDCRLYALNGAGKYLLISVRSAGSVELYHFDGTTLTQIATMNALGASVGTLYPLTVVKDGLQIYVEFNGRQMVGTLTSDQESVLTGRQVYLTSVTAITGHGHDSVYVGNITKPANKLTVRNASVSGTGFSYHTTNIATEIPEAPDLAVISLGHNESSTPSQFVTDYQTYVAAVRSQTGEQTPIVATIQNPRTDASATAHANRMGALKSACAPNRWDRVDTFQAFSDDGGGVASLLQGDGVHPNTTGSLLWEQTAQARFGF